MSTLQPHLALGAKQLRDLQAALAHAHYLHSQAGGAGLGVSAGVLHDVPIFVRGGQGGRGWWTNLGSALKTGVTELQKSDVVRGVEKRAVHAAAGVVRGAAETALDGLGDSIAPEFAPLIDGAVDRGLSGLQRRGEAAVDARIDASGSGHCQRCMGGQGMRLSGQYGGSMALAGAM